MKHFFSLVLLAVTLSVSAQYITPGTGVRYNLDSLAALSAGVVFVNGDHYEINGNITISAGDTVEILSGTTILLHDLSYIQSSGKFTVDAVQPVVFTALDSLSLNKWRGFKFLEGHETFINNAIIQYGGGIKVNSGGTFTIQNSTLQRNYYKSGSTSGSFSSAAVIDLTGPARVIGNRIIYNQRGAVASGANTSTPAEIRNNYIFGNTTENSNRPQINMGPAGEGGTTFIVGNSVIGNGAVNAGGIAYSSLMGVAGDAVIDSNYVAYNRYGITVTGSGMNAWVRYNTVLGNNIQNNPDLGGSGINFTASSSSSYQHIMATGNIIEGNLWGITIVGYPVVNLGNTDPAAYNPGMNVFRNNGNNGILYDLYNNGAVEQYAMGNHWGVDSQDEASIEGMITHQADNAALGLVHFMPASQTVIFSVTDMENNPVEGASITISGIAQPLVTSSAGTASSLIHQGTYNFDVALEGFSTVSSAFTLAADTLEISVQLTDAVYMLTFSVTDGTLPVEGALINVGTFQVTTNAGGMANIGILPGTYDYDVTREGFEPESGTVTIINEPVTENVILTAIIPVYEYTVTFNVTRDELPVQGAVISIADTSLLTGTDGVATIDLIDGEYPYTITAQWSDTITGTVTVAGADVTIEAGLVTGVANQPTVEFSAWPNPASDYLNLTAGSVNANQPKSGMITVAQVSTLTCRTVRTITNPGERISLQGLPSGWYLLKVQINGTWHTQKISIK